MLTLSLEVTEVRKTQSGIVLSLSRPSGIEEIPPPESEEEAMMFQVMRAMEKYMRLPIPIAQPSVPTVTIILNEEEYDRIGRPTVGDSLRLVISKEEGGFRVGVDY
ncbi:hypothetical protein D9Q81_02550 [Candidatus Korarchaeum cryptofilum]|jgi:hypothetical protein|uniref:Uncharacterized protein n=2 Tax=Candidatus Korarchaeum cryptofilum TaxID=498846 RepID=B1L5X1_KORCO|nr:arcadin 1 [Candidatus Korarchaeum cryptofilum]ACB07850.1 hypothetical protein Kcr_1104 [Candidatus Korarchaeum cryptofilum OPF8]RSN69503.1 hypothetical protein D9Q81_02550 [Candidatus Korarchaeum cryptofilum]